MNLTISHLEKAKDSKEFPPYIREAITSLLAAINDWPNPIKELNEYEEAVYRFVGKDVTKNKLEGHIANTDLSKNAWQAESLTQLLDVFDHYEGKSLKEIMRDIQVKVLEKH
ncbi:MAG TPA: hypothetical protein VD993_11345 [Chitinophagaceae bacterium]|nr:hypothetical protein [Chitinophagaceae bacterium]